MLGLAAWAAAYAAIQPLSEWLTFRAFGLARGVPPRARAVAFFLYDTPKVLLLLVLIVFVVGIVRSFFTAERTRAILAGKRESVGNVLAALLGVVTPFCSCSAVPLFIGFVEVGVPLGVTLSFLISAPMVNEIALVLLFGLFGWKVAALYLVTGLTIAIVAGFILGRMKLERFVEPWVYESMKAEATFEKEQLGFTGRVEKGAGGGQGDRRQGLALGPRRHRRRRRHPRLRAGGAAGELHGQVGLVVGAGGGRSSASRCTRTPPASSRWSRRCSARARRSGPCSPS